MAAAGNTDAGFLLGLIGYPIKHSASPAMQEAAAAALGRRAMYRLIEFAGAGPAELRLLLEGVRRLGFRGVNVTFPYKEAVIPFLDELSDGAARIRAVNVVVVADGRLVGHNTDATGFIRGYDEAIGQPLDAPVAMIGAGGVGKAMAFALAGRGVPDLRIFDRDAARAAELAAALGPAARAVATLAEAVSGARGIVNGTPVGMAPNVDTPVPADLISADQWVADAVYSPLWTPLLRIARAKGARTMTGREFNIAQAGDGFRLFTGLEPDMAAMGRAFDAVIAARDKAKA